MGPHLYELAFLSIILGVSLGVGQLARSSWFLERTDPARRIAAESGALAGAALGLLLAAFAPALFLAPQLADPLDPRRLGAIALTLAHVIAIGLVALRVPAAPALRPTAGAPWCLADPRTRRPRAVKSKTLFTTS